MRLLALVAVATAATVAAGSVASTGEGALRPTLRLMDKQPLKLRGTSFKPRERVRVTVETAGERQSRTLTASATGAFVAAFTVRFDPCNFEAWATGSRGSRASHKLPQRLCPIGLGTPAP